MDVIRKIRIFFSEAYTILITYGPHSSSRFGIAVFQKIPSEKKKFMAPSYGCGSTA